jgi:UDP-N-acetylglucosamine acyltransferase
VHPEATVAEDAQIGPYCVVGPKVTLGPATRLVSHVTIDGRTTLGRGNVVYPFTSLGTEPQDLKYEGGETRLQIGDENVFREGVTVNTGTEVGGGVTAIGSRNLLMGATHVAHDCVLEDGIVMANGALLGGHVRIQSGAIVSGGALVHHFVSIGRLAFVAGGAHINTDAPPFMMIHGVKPRVHAVNAVGLKRRGMGAETLEALRQAHRIVWRSGLPRRDALKRLQKELGGVAEVAELVGFLTASLDGKNGRALEARRHP